MCKIENRPEVKDIEAIANTLGFDTLETRGSDRLDFADVAVWSIKDALEMAYELGRSSK